MAKNKDLADQIEAEANAQLPEVGKLTRKDGLSTGSTLLNLACSGNPYWGFAKGMYYFLVGDSASGKTFFSMTCFAEAMISKRFRDYRLIYDNVENGMLMDVERLFGKAVADRMESPAKGEDGKPVFSSTVEEFYYNLDDALDAGKPFIYVLDSMDALTSAQEVEKFEEHKEAHRKGKESAGSYGDGKAKKNSEGLRKVLSRLRDTGSILIIICQTRDNLGFGFEKKTRSGGHALKFYATVEIWTSIIGSIKKTLTGRDREIGKWIGLHVKKNRLTGKTPKVDSAIYPDYGIDDIGTCVDYLVDEGYWKKTKQSIEAGEFDVILTRDKLIEKIETEGWVEELRGIVGKCWREIEEKTREAALTGRKPRY